MAVESDFGRDDSEGGRCDPSQTTVVGAHTPYPQSTDTTNSQTVTGNRTEEDRDNLYDIDIVKNTLNTSASASATSSTSSSAKVDEKQNRYDSYYMNMTAGEDLRLNNQSRAVRTWDRIDGQTVDKIGCLMESYENLLESQLLDQQTYFEKKLARETILALEESLRRRKCMAIATVDSHRPPSDAIENRSRTNDDKVCNGDISRRLGNRWAIDGTVTHSDIDNMRDNDSISSAASNKVASDINQSEVINYNHTNGSKIDNDSDSNNYNYNFDNDNINDRNDNDNDRNDDNDNTDTSIINSNNDNDKYDRLSPTDFEAIDEQLARVEISKIEISSLEHEYSIILTNLKDVESKNKIMKKKNEILIKEQKILREHVEQLNNSEEETKRKCEEEVNELEQQIRDLCFYTKMKNQVASSPMRDELEGGSVVMPASISFPVSQSQSSSSSSSSQSGAQYVTAFAGSKKKSVLSASKKSK